MNGEVEYRPVAGFPDYRIGDDGSFWSRKTGEWVEPKSGRVANKKHKHMLVNMCQNGRIRTTYVHRLVLEAFVGPCPDGMECCHKDGNPANNRLDNLRWDTHAANMADMQLTGGNKSTRGENNGNARIKAKEVLLIVQLAAAGVRQADIARRFSVLPNLVNRILRGWTWSHLTGIPRKTRFVP